MEFVPARPGTPVGLDEPQKAGKHPLVVLHGSRKAAAKMAEDDPWVKYMRNWLRCYILEKREVEECIDRMHPELPPSCTCFHDYDLSESKMLSCMAYLWAFALFIKR